jgi:hypothetical protein
MGNLGTEGTDRMTKILSRIPGMCGSVTSNNTWVRIGYRIYSLWRCITTQVKIIETTIALA